MIDPFVLLTMPSNCSNSNHLSVILSQFPVFYCGNGIWHVFNSVCDTMYTVYKSVMTFLYVNKINVCLSVCRACFYPRTASNSEKSLALA